MSVEKTLPKKAVQDGKRGIEGSNTLKLPPKLSTSPTQGRFSSAVAFLSLPLHRQSDKTTAERQEKALLDLLTHFIQLQHLKH